MQTIIERVAPARPGAVGAFYIQSLLDGFVLDIKYRDHQPGTPVIVYPRNIPANTNQLWKLTEDGYIQSLMNGFVLDIPEAYDLAPVVVNPRSNPGRTGQLWTLTEDGYIQSLLNGFVLDILDGSTEPLASLVIHPRNVPGTTNQLWKLVLDI